MKIGFVGAGNMAEAMLSALIRSGRVDPARIAVSDVRTDRLRLLARKYGVCAFGANAEAAKFADVLVLSVKPQQFDEVLPEIAPHAGPRLLVISIAAGRKTAGIARLLPGARIVRVMPNMACAVGEAMSVFTAGPNARPADLRLTRRLLGAFGRVMELPEAKFHAVTALSGSGPAFLAFAADALAQGAVRMGLSRAHADALAVQTMLGTARLLSERAIRPAELIASVASARGTTAAGLAVLERRRVRGALGETVAAAARRSRELSR